MDQNQHGKSTLPTVFPVTSHTDHVGSGSTFVAIKGFKTDGLLFAPCALERGATTLVVQQDVLVSEQLQILIDCKKVNVLRVTDTRKALADLSAQAADYPAHKMKIIGITGTKGKTTTSFLLKHMLSGIGYKTALLSTAGNYIENDFFPASLTTAQPDYLHQFLRLCVMRGITHVVMEVAAQAMTLHRVAGITFNAVIFTNFGLEHLEFYDSLDSYFEAKCQLLDQRAVNARAYINRDDQRCASLTDAHDHMVSFGINTEADIIIDAVQPRRLQFNMCFKGLWITIECPALSGMFNAYNVAAGVGVLLDWGIAPDVITKALHSFAGAPGRFERHTLSNGALGIIDYAHNPLSYQAILPELKALTDHLIVIFGAGGERDASRRPLMGLAVAHYADVMMVTNDNPRSEPPYQIVEDICAQVPAELRYKIIVELDRELAIKKAYELSSASTVIAVLGKGPDCYQIIGANKMAFYEAEIFKAL